MCDWPRTAVRVYSPQAAHVLVNTYPLTLDKSLWHLHTIWHPIKYTFNNKALKISPALVSLNPCLMYWTPPNPAASFSFPIQLLLFPFASPSSSVGKRVRRTVWYSSVEVAPIQRTVTETHRDYWFLLLFHVSQQNLQAEPWRFSPQWRQSVWSITASHSSSK